MQILARAVGRRKEAVAQVQIVRGTGQFIINNKPAHEYLQNDSCSLLSVKAPFEIFTQVQNASKGKESGKSAAETSTNNGNNANVEVTPSLQYAQETERSSSVLKDSISEFNSNSTNQIYNNIDTIVKVKGGGLMGQSEAIRLGISRAVCFLELSETNLNKDQKTKENIQANELLSLESQFSGEAANAPEVPGAEPHSLSGLRKQLKAKGYLTQDARVKERRKYGLKKARKASQYHKR